MAPGRYADLVLLDYERMAIDVVDDMCDETDLLLARMRAEFVDTVIVAGQEVVRDGRAVGVDLEALEREAIVQTRAAGKALAAVRPVLERHREILRGYYSAGEHLRAS